MQPNELFLLASFGELQGDGADVGLRDRLVLGLRSLGRRSRGLGLRSLSRGLDRLFRRGIEHTYLTGNLGVREQGSQLAQVFLSQFHCYGDFHFVLPPCFSSKPNRLAYFVDFRKTH